MSFPNTSNPVCPEPVEGPGSVKYCQADSGASISSAQTIVGAVFVKITGALTA